MAYSCRK